MLMQDHNRADSNRSELCEQIDKRTDDLISYVRNQLDDLLPLERQNRNLQSNDSTISSIIISARKSIKSKSFEFNDLELEEAYTYLLHEIKRRRIGHDICNESLRSLFEEIVDRANFAIRSHSEFENFDKTIQRHIEETARRIIKTRLVEIDTLAKNWHTVYSLQDTTIVNATDNIPSIAIASGKRKARQDKRIKEHHAPEATFADTRIEQELNELLEITRGDAVSRAIFGKNLNPHDGEGLYIVFKVQSNLERTWLNRDKNNRGPKFNPGDSDKRNESMVGYVVMATKNEFINWFNRSKYKDFPEDPFDIAKKSGSGALLKADPYEDVIHHLDVTSEISRATDLFRRQEIQIGVVVSGKLNEQHHYKTRDALSEIIELSLIALSVQRRRLLDAEWNYTFESDDHFRDEEEFWMHLVNQALCHWSPGWSDHYNLKLPDSESSKPGVRFGKEAVQERANYQYLLRRTRGFEKSSDQLIKDGVMGFLKRTRDIAGREFDQQDAYAETNARHRSNDNSNRMRSW